MTIHSNFPSSYPERVLDSGKRHRQRATNKKEKKNKKTASSFFFILVTFLRVVRHNRSTWIKLNLVADAFFALIFAFEERLKANPKKALEGHRLVGLTHATSEIMSPVVTFRFNNASAFNRPGKFMNTACTRGVQRKPVSPGCVSLSRCFSLSLCLCSDASRFAGVLY